MNKKVVSKKMFTSSNINIKYFISARICCPHIPILWFCQWKLTKNSTQFVGKSSWHRTFINCHNYSLIAFRNVSCIPAYSSLKTQFDEDVRIPPDEVFLNFSLTRIVNTTVLNVCYLLNFDLARVEYYN